MSTPAQPAIEKGSPAIHGEKSGEQASSGGAHDQSSLNAPASAEKPWLDRLHLPTWAVTNLRSPRSRKIWLRCWIASWVAYVILLPNASLRELGNAYVNFAVLFML